MDEFITEIEPHVIEQDRFWRVERPHVRVAGKRARHWLFRPGSDGEGVAVLPIAPGKADVHFIGLTVEQRYAKGGALQLNAPRGFGSTPGAPTLDARQIVERKVGVVADAIERLGDHDPDTGSRTDSEGLYVAHVATPGTTTPEQPGGPIQRRVWLPHSEVNALIHVGVITCGYTTALMHYAELAGHLPRSPLPELPRLAPRMVDSRIHLADDVLPGARAGLRRLATVVRAYERQYTDAAGDDAVLDPYLSLGPRHQLMALDASGYRIAYEHERRSYWLLDVTPTCSTLTVAVRLDHREARKRRIAAARLVR